jgi:hypothetical protein
MWLFVLLWKGYSVKAKFWSVIIILSLLILSACQSLEFSKTIETNLPTPNSGEKDELSISYPITDTETPINQAYPYPIDYEDSFSTTLQEGPEFNIIEPVVGGQTIIEGWGPANVPIILIDVTELGTILGETTIDDDGSFSFELDEPVISGHSIGIQLGDTTNTNINPTEYQYSPNYYDRPQVGILFDLVHVE